MPPPDAERLGALVDALADLVDEAVIDALLALTRALADRPPTMIGAGERNEAVGHAMVEVFEAHGIGPQQVVDRAAATGVPLPRLAESLRRRREKEHPP